MSLTWTKRTAGIGYKAASIIGQCLCKDLDSNVYCATSLNPSGNRLYKSSDNGDTWLDMGFIGVTSANSAGIGIIGSVLYSAIVVGSYYNVYKSIDGGVSWTITLTNPLQTHPHFQFYVAGKALNYLYVTYAGTNRVATYSADGGDTWLNTNAVSDSALLGYLLAENELGNVVGINCVGNNAHFSSDGESFSHSAVGVTGLSQTYGIQAFQSRFFAYGYGSTKRFYYSDDGGKTFTPGGSFPIQYTFNNQIQNLFELDDLMYVSLRDNDRASVYRSDFDGSAGSMLELADWWDDLGAAYETVETLISGSKIIALVKNIGFAPLDAYNAVIPVPDPPTITADGGVDKVTLTWNSVPGATSYNLYWSTTPGVTQGTGTKIPSVTSEYEHITPTNNEPYYYVITAENGAGESIDSNEVSGTPIGGMSSLVATAGINNIVLTWDSIDGADSYNIYWSTSSGVTQETGQLLLNVTSGYIFETEHYVPHYFVATAIAGGDETDDSNEASAIPLAILPKTNKLLEQYKNKIKINDLIDALYSDHIEVLKGILVTFHDRLNIDASSGNQLDNIGTIVGQTRFGFNDVEYRLMLKAKIGVNNSKGTIEDIISIWGIMTQAEYIWVQEIFPAQINLLADVGLPVSIKDLAVALIRTVLGAGIKLGIVGIYDPNSFGFGEHFGGFGACWGTTY